METKEEKAVKILMSKVPRPHFSEHHAPGGTLAQRDAAERARDKEQLDNILDNQAKLVEDFAARQEAVKEKKRLEKVRKENREKNKKTRRKTNLL